MPVACTRVRITLLNNQLMERVWNNLAALDFAVEESWDSSGVFVGDWPSEDTNLLAKVTGVAAVERLPPREQKFIEQAPRESTPGRAKRTPKKER